MGSEVRKPNLGSSSVFLLLKRDWIVSPGSAGTPRPTFHALGDAALASFHSEMTGRSARLCSWLRIPTEAVAMENRGTAVTGKPIQATASTRR